MSQKSITQYFIVNSYPLIRFCSCHFCVLKHGEKSWLLLWSAHICNANTKSNLWRQDKNKTKTAILALLTGPLVWHHTGGVGRNLFAFELWTNTTSYSNGALKHKAIPASPWDFALGMVQHCPADGSYLCFLLMTHTEGSWTLRKSFPRLPLHPSPSHSHHKAEVWVLLDAAGGSEKPPLACRWTVNKFSCWAEHSPPDY